MTGAAWGAELNDASSIADQDITPRQGEVLNAALALLVSVGDKLTMAAVARKASCSKETLYKWFGDRDGLLVATVQWQAAKVRVPVLDRAHLDRRSLARSLEMFARDLLTVLAGEISVTLNRIAISHAGADSAGLGAIVLENGRRALGNRLKPVLEAGRNVALLKFPDSEEAFCTFFGLVVRDVQIRLLLGDVLVLSREQIEKDANTATKQFFTLFGV